MKPLVLLFDFGEVRKFHFLQMCFKTYRIEKTKNNKNHPPPQKKRRKEEKETKCKNNNKSLTS